MAVFTLPDQLFTFYKSNIEFITEHAVDPDKRRYAAHGEAPRHYIDIDHYAHGEEDPFDVVPKRWDDAVAKFTEDTLQAYGIVPWHLEVMVYRLTRAFKEKNIDRILRLSSDLGHYVGDAHVPLHTTENYNGQLTNQVGIHGFWESRVPELFAENFDYFIGKAQYVSDPLEKAWETVEASHRAVDSVLNFERELTQAFPSDQKYAYENRGAVIMKVYSQDFSKAFDEKLNGMVERRMRSAIHTVGSLWYTAWVKAGKPDLTDLMNKSVSAKLEDEFKKENASFQNGKIKGRAHDR